MVCTMYDNVIRLSFKGQLVKRLHLKPLEAWSKCLLFAALVINHSCYHHQLCGCFYPKEFFFTECILPLCCIFRAFLISGYTLSYECLFTLKIQYIAIWILRCLYYFFILEVFFRNLTRYFFCIILKFLTTEGFSIFSSVKSDWLNDFSFTLVPKTFLMIKILFLMKN